MALEVSGSTSLVNQDVSTKKAQSGFDILTRSQDKTEQTMINEQLRLEIAEHTGKGLNLDVRG